MHTFYSLKYVYVQHLHEHVSTTFNSFAILVAIRSTTVPGTTGTGSVLDTVSVRGLDTVVITNSIVRGRISDYILIASRRYD